MRLTDFEELKPLVITNAAVTKRLNKKAGKSKDVNRLLTVML